MANMKVKMAEKDEAVEPEVVEEVAAVVEEVEVETELDDDEVVDEGPVELEDLDPKAEFWPDGPLVGQLQEWKEKYRKVFISAVSEDDYIIWRSLSRPEYRTYMERVEELSEVLSPVRAQLQIEEEISSVAMLYPTYDEMMEKSNLGALPTLISQQVLEASGFVSLDTRRL